MLSVQHLDRCPVRVRSQIKKVKLRVLGELAGPTGEVDEPPPEGRPEGSSRPWRRRVEALGPSSEAAPVAVPELHEGAFGSPPAPPQSTGSCRPSLLIIAVPYSSTQGPPPSTGFSSIFFRPMARRLANPPEESLPTHFEMALAVAASPR